MLCGLTDLCREAVTLRQIQLSRAGKPLRTTSQLYHVITFKLHLGLLGATAKNHSLIITNIIIITLILTISMTVIIIIIIIISISH